MKSTNTHKTLTASLLLLFTATAHANECNDIAPLADHSNVENGYFDVNGHSITEADRTRLEKLAGALRGHWRGVELVKECVGHFKTPTEELQRYRVDAEITRHPTGAIRIEAEKARQSDNVLKLDTLFISPEIDLDYGRAHGWHTLEFIDDNTVIFSEKSRVLSGNTFARFLHTVKKIELRENKLTVDRLLYVNGHFVEQNGWILER